MAVIYGGCRAAGDRDSIRWKRAAEHSQPPRSVGGPRASYTTGGGET